MQESHSDGVGLSCFVLNRLVGEYMKNGFVRISQKLVDWQWYDDNNVKVVFLHLLLTANQKPKLWHGQELAAGELITGYEVLADSVGLTMQQLRTALDKLKQTGEISITTNRHHTKITVHNWEYYKVYDNQPNNKPITNQTPAKPYQNAKEQQTDNRPITNQQQTEPKIKERTEKKEKEPKRKKREERNIYNNNYNNENLCLDNAAQDLSCGCSRVSSLLSAILGGKVSPQDRLVVNGLVKTYGEQWTAEALEIMHKAGKAEIGKADFRYAEGVLKNWRTYGKNITPPKKQTAAQGERIITNNTDYNSIYALYAPKPWRAKSPFSPEAEAWFNKDLGDTAAEDEPPLKHRRLTQ